MCSEKWALLVMPGWRAHCDPGSSEEVVAEAVHEHAHISVHGTGLDQRDHCTLGSATRGACHMQES